MRRIETAIRQQKDTRNLAQASGDSELAQTCSTNIRKLLEKYDNVCKVSGLEQRYDKTHVADTGSDDGGSGSGLTGGGDGGKISSRLLGSIEKAVSNTEKRITIDLQLFGEKDLEKQATLSLQNGIDALQGRIAEHETKIANPKAYYPDWDSYSKAEQIGRIKHWEKELRNFKESIQNREDELRKRGENDGAVE